MKKVIILSFLLILSGCSYNKDKIKTIVSQFKNNGVEHIKEELGSLKKTEVKQAEDLSEELNHKEYKDKKTGFSLLYPNNVRLEGKATQKYFSLNIEVKNIKTDEITGFTSDDLVILEKNMKKGEFGDISGWTLENSQKISKIGKKIIETGVVFSKFDICSVVFERNLSFFEGDYLVNISLIADPDQIIKENSDFFYKDLANCSGGNIWYFERQGEFYSKLKDAKIGEKAQEWFNTFDEIINSLKMGESLDNSGLKKSVKIKQKVLSQQNSGLNLVWPEISGINNSESYYKIIKKIDFSKNTGKDLREVKAEYKNCKCGLIASSYAVNYNQNNILSISLILDYVQAYPTEVVKNYVFNIENGEKLEINNLIKAEKQKNLIKLCNQKLQENIKKAIAIRNKKNLDIPLKNFKGEFTSENFSNYILSDQGLEFFYNFNFPQAVKSASPESLIFIPFSELGDDYFLLNI